MLTSALSDVSIADTGIAAILGYVVVFAGLIILQLVITLLGKAFTAAEKKKAPTEIVEEAPVVAVEPETAPGSAGKLKLWNVDPKTAAMIMAIVADKLQKPINELRFISIKEVEQ